MSIFARLKYIKTIVKKQSYMKKTTKTAETSTTVVLRLFFFSSYASNTLSELPKSLTDFSLVVFCFGPPLRFCVVFDLGRNIYLDTVH